MSVNGPHIQAYVASVKRRVDIAFAGQRMVQVFKCLNVISIQAARTFGQNSSGLGVTEVGID